MILDMFYEENTKVVVSYLPIWEFFFSMHVLANPEHHTPDDLNYPDWHHWGGSSRKEAITFAEKLQQEIDSTVINWNSPEEAAEDIKRLLLE